MKLSEIRELQTTELQEKVYELKQEPNNNLHYLQMM